MRRRSPVLCGAPRSCVVLCASSTGRGDVKLLQNKETGIIRVLLRQDKTLKLCMNHKGQWDALVQDARETMRAGLLYSEALHLTSLSFPVALPLLALVLC